MSRYPSATWKPIANRSSQALQKDLLSLHTCVGPGLGTWSYFNTGAGGRGVYSHIIVCGIWGSDAGKNVDGLALQAQDTNLRAAANLDGNWHIISVETADNAVRPIAPWTPKQCDRIVAIMVDAHRIDGIPLVLVPDSKPGRRGISYHRQGCNPYRVAGGELWSTAYGKDCPTQARINQIPGLIKRAQAIVGGTTPPPAPAPLNILEEIMALYDTPAAYEAAVAKATANGVGAALAAWLPRTVAAANGRPNAFYPDAAVNDDDQEAALAVAKQTNDLLAQLLAKQGPTPGV